jgi:hypothetical protein
MNEGINNLCNTIAWVIKAAVVLVVLCALGWGVLIGYAYYSETHKSANPAGVEITPAQNGFPAATPEDPPYFTKYPVSRDVYGGELGQICPLDSPVTLACQNLFRLPAGVSCVGKPYRSCLGSDSPETLPADYFDTHDTRCYDKNGKLTGCSR